jgi:hypothetical protein
MKKKKLLTLGVAFMLVCAPILTGCEQTLENILIGVLTGFEKAPDPTIKEGKFNFSVTYEAGGEVQTISSVFVCEFEESGMSLGGWYIHWNSYIEDYDKYPFKENTHDIIVETNEDGTIYLELNLNSAYFMAEPGYSDVECQPHLFILYNEEAAERFGAYGDDSVEVLESYGVKLISYEYDAPLENIYE